MKNILFVSIFFFFLTNCGYTPLYNNNSSQDISINIIDYKGDKYLNKKLIIELEKRNVVNIEDIYNVNIDTIFDKKIISKDKHGKTTNFELIASIFFEVEKNNIKQVFSFKESSKIANKNNSFEQQKYENIIKENFAKSIKRKFIFELNNLKKQND